MLRALFTDAIKVREQFATALYFQEGAIRPTLKD